MKNLKSYFYLVFVVFILLGCGNHNNTEAKSEQILLATNSSDNNMEITEIPDSVKLQNRTTPVDTNANEATPKTSQQFTKFLLFIDYGNDQSYEVEYEKKSIGIEAKIVDTRAQEKVIGKDAYVKINNLLKKLKIHKGTPASDVKHKLITVFKIDENYQKIDVELRFTDGNEKEFTFYP